MGIIFDKTSNDDKYHIQTELSYLNFIYFR